MSPDKDSPSGIVSDRTWPDEAIWPFDSIPPELYWSLRPDHRKVVENTMRKLIHSLLATGE